jgi:hypothetical protein
MCAKNLGYPSVWSSTSYATAETPATNCFLWKVWGTNSGARDLNKAGVIGLIGSHSNSYEHILLWCANPLRRVQFGHTNAKLGACLRFSRIKRPFGPLPGAAVDLSLHFTAASNQLKLRLGHPLDNRNSGPSWLPRR